MAISKPTKDRQVHFRELLEEAVTKPGTVMKAYSLFWNYSLGNQLLALVQAAERGIALGPIASYNRWRELGRQVRRGEKGIVLCRPVTVKRTATESTTDGDDSQTDKIFTRFVFRAYWFFLSQTEGEDYQTPAVPDWNREGAFSALDVSAIPFTMMDGNCQGYAKGREIAISPVAEMPEKTIFHELAHVILGHTTEDIHDSEMTPRSLRESEAECTAMLCLEALGLKGAEYCRGYVQSWIGQNPISERSAQKILVAADRILKAGLAPTGELAEN